MAMSVQTKAPSTITANFQPLSTRVLPQSELGWTICDTFTRESGRQLLCRNQCRALDLSELSNGVRSVSSRASAAFNRHRTRVIHPGRLAHSRISLREMKLASCGIPLPSSAEATFLRTFFLGRKRARERGAGETGDPRENLPTSGIVRHDSQMQNSDVNRPGIEPGSPWWEASVLTAQLPYYVTVLFLQLPTAESESFSFVIAMAVREGDRTCDCSTPTPKKLQAFAKYSHTVVLLVAVLELTFVLLVHTTPDTNYPVLYSVHYWLVIEQWKAERSGRLLTARSREPMRVIEVSMERRRNERTRETDDPRAKPAGTSGIVRHDFHLRKFESEPAGDRTRFALVGGDQ
ncbi:hypothetical protein PR048_002698 [Dryococelus australis]|uniref:Uncharacterized protein n=1 Tax=Dryococelus australis TaxID=614101 RepID=A0ABQ9ILL3_9NEOP|nr:hypothetical protein PR048_002698 [Dryococelus australis]